MAGPLHFSPPPVGPYPDNIAAVLQKVTENADASREACIERMWTSLPQVSTSTDTLWEMMCYYLCHEDRIREMRLSAQGFSGNGRPQRQHLLLSYPCAMPPGLVVALVDRVRKAFPGLVIKYTVDSFSYLVIWAEW
jgi:hypothetical protein